MAIESMTDDQVLDAVLGELRRQLDGAQVRPDDRVSNALFEVAPRGLHAALAERILREIRSRRRAQLLAHRATLVAKMASLPKPPLH